MIIHSSKHLVSEQVWRYNGPPTSKIAAIFLFAEDDIAGRQDIVIRRCEELHENGSDQFDTIPIIHRSCDPLSDVQFLPQGTNERHLGLQLYSSSPSRLHSTRMALLMIYAYQLFQRPNQFNTILQGGRLFQQFVVDQFQKVESESLEYLRHNQVSLRGADYFLLCEQLGDSGSTENEVDFF